jgi:hypothetical protein
MRTLYIEDLANHDGPEPCVGCPRGRRRSVGRGTRRRAIEPRQSQNRGADAVIWCGRQHRRRRFREPVANPAGSENQCMRGVSRCENREVPRSPACGDGRAGRAGKAEAVIS